MQLAFQSKLLTDSPFFPHWNLSTKDEHWWKGNEKNPKQIGQSSNFHYSWKMRGADNSETRVLKNNLKTQSTSTSAGSKAFKKLQLTAKSIKSPSLPLESINHIHGGDRLPSRMFSVGHSIANHILKEDLKNPSGFLIDQPTDPLHTTSSRKPANGRLGDTLNVISENLPVALGTSLTQALSTLSTARHFQLEF